MHKVNEILQTAFTDHMVDDLSPADQAMERLRQQLPFFTLGVRVSQDGTLMTFHNKHYRFPESRVNQIRRVIAADSLPLRVEHNTPFPWKNEDFIHVIYTGKP